MYGINDSFIEKVQCFFTVCKQAKLSYTDHGHLAKKLKTIISQSILQPRHEFKTVDKLVGIDKHDFFSTNISPKERRTNLSSIQSAHHGFQHTFFPEQYHTNLDSTQLSGDCIFHHPI